MIYAGASAPALPGPAVGYVAAGAFHSCLREEPPQETLKPNHRIEFFFPKFIAISARGARQRGNARTCRIGAIHLGTR